MSKPARDTPIPGPGDVIVTTKLHIPRAREGLIVRESLVETLVDGAARRLVLLSAPAGSGKTTLVAQWHASPKEQRRFAWVSLDGGDNDEVRFWTYVIEALRTVIPGIGEPAAAALRASTLRITDLVLPLLVNDLTARGIPVVIVLDDYHVITQRRINEGLGYLLGHLPEETEIAIATRSEPQLQIARLRARGEIIEVSAAELRFSSDETATLLNDTLALELSTEDVERLQRRTEGWAAALYLAALSLHGRTDRHDFIESFEGDDRQVVDYLLTEVLAGEDEDVRSFLLWTSVLERLNGELCDAVTARAGGAAMLERLERSNLFLVPLDSRRKWFRYHHLFAELLRHELNRREPEHVPEFHRRAQLWCAAAGMAPEAIHHALAAGDRTAATELVLGCWSEYFNRGQLDTVARWLAALGESAVKADVGLCVASAWLALDDGRLTEARKWIDEAEDAAESAGATEQADIATLRAVHSFKTGDVGQAEAAARRVLELAPEGASFARSAGTCVLGISRYWQGADADALATLVEAERLAHESGNVLGRTYALGYRGAITAGIDVDEAAPLADEAMRLAEDPAVGEHFVAMMAHLARGRVRLGRGEAELAEADFSRAVELSRRRAAAVEVAFALVELGRARMLSGAPERARAGLEAAARALEHCRDPGKIADEVARDKRRARPRSARHEADELTARELDVLRLFASELSQREIGAALYVSLNTVKSHARGIFRKLDAANRDEAVAKAHERGLL